MRSEFMKMSDHDRFHYIAERIIKAQSEGGKKLVRQEIRDIAQKIGTNVSAVREMGGINSILRARNRSRRQRRKVDEKKCQQQASLAANLAIKKKYQETIEDLPVVKMSRSDIAKLISKQKNLYLKMQMASEEKL